MRSADRVARAVLRRLDGARRSGPGPEGVRVEELASYLLMRGYREKMAMRVGYAREAAVALDRAGYTVDDLDRLWRCIDLRRARSPQAVFASMVGRLLRDQV